METMAKDYEACARKVVLRVIGENGSVYPTTVMQLDHEFKTVCKKSHRPPSAYKAIDELMDLNIVTEFRENAGDRFPKYALTKAGLMILEELRRKESIASQNLQQAKQPKQLK